MGQPLTSTVPESSILLGSITCMVMPELSIYFEGRALGVNWFIIHQTYTMSQFINQNSNCFSITIRLWDLHSIHHSPYFILLVVDVLYENSVWLVMITKKIKTQQNHQSKMFHYSPNLYHGHNLLINLQTTF